MNTDEKKIKFLFLNNYNYLNKIEKKFKNFKSIFQITNLNLKNLYDNSYLTKPYTILQQSKETYFKYNPYLLVFHSFFKQHQKNVKHFTKCFKLLNKNSELPSFSLFCNKNF